jgi:amidohydrolase
VTTALPPLDVDQLVADRRDLHRHPELGYQETRTAGLVASRLRLLGYDVRTGVGRTGVVGVRRGAGERCVMVRADMDALPVTEDNDVPYRSQRDGVMHACGHDGHVAASLGVARRLAAVDLPGIVKFAFQPAEEGGRGAAAMIDDGALDAPAVGAAFGMHLWSELPTGTIAVAPGPVMASVDTFRITVTGRGGHAAIPHLAVDPVVVASHLVTALQTLVSRQRNPADPAVVSVTSIHAGTTHNVIPDRATLEGTVRTFGGPFFDTVPARLGEMARSVAAAFDAEAEVTYERAYPPTVNDAEMAVLMAEVAAEVVGAEHVRADYRTMAGEDMAFFLERVPGCYAFVGCRNPAKGAEHPHHSPRFDIDEDALPLAAELLSRVALRFLSR